MGLAKIQNFSDEIKNKLCNSVHQSVEFMSIIHIINSTCSHNAVVYKIHRKFGSCKIIIALKMQKKIISLLLHKVATCENKITVGRNGAVSVLAVNNGLLNTWQRFLKTKEDFCQIILSQNKTLPELWRRVLYLCIVKIRQWHNLKNVCVCE